MGITLLVLGCFLWFALAFNGGIGETFVNYSAMASGLFMVGAGLLLLLKGSASLVRGMAVLALLTYGAVIWQRFNYDFNTDWVGFAFDCVFATCMLAVIVRGNPAAPSRADR